MIFSRDFEKFSTYFFSYRYFVPKPVVYFVFVRFILIFGGYMNIDLKTDRGNVVIKFSGEMDEHSVKSVRERIDEIIDRSNGLRTMTFDMSGVTFIDSTGLGFVIGRYKKLKAVRAELVLCGVSKPVDKVFSTSGIYRFVPVMQ